MALFGVNVTSVIVNFVNGMENVPMRKEVLKVKLLNYDCRDLILKNLRSVTVEIPSKYTKCQYRILCNIIRQKHITKQFFDFLLLQLYDLEDWKQLSYQQMYELIYILTYYNYKKEK